MQVTCGAVWRCTSIQLTNKRRMWDATRSNNKTNFQFCVRALPMYRGSMWLFSKYKKTLSPSIHQVIIPAIRTLALLLKRRKNRDENTYPRAHHHVELNINWATFRRKEKGRVQDYKVANMASHTACLVYTVGMECCSLLQFQVSDNTPLRLLKFYLPRPKEANICHSANDLTK